MEGVGKSRQCKDATRRISPSNHVPLSLRHHSQLALVTLTVLNRVLKPARSSAWVDWMVDQAGSGQATALANRQGEDTVASPAVKALH